MRGLNRFATTPGRNVAVAAVAPSFSSHPYSTFSSFGGAGGRGRGRGSGSHPISPQQPRVPGQPDVAAGDDEDPISSAFGHGRGRSPFPATPDLPSFSSLMSSLNRSASAGRGRPASPSSPHHQEAQPKKPIFFRRSDPDNPPEKTPFADPEESAPLPPSLSPILAGSGRGKPTRIAESDSKPSEENRHIRNSGQPIGQRLPSVPSQQKLGREEAVRKAVDILSRGGPSGPTRGRGGRGMLGRGRGRGRGDRFGGGRGRRDADEEFELYVGDNADGEKLEKRLGAEKMKILAEGFEEMSWRVLPSPIDEAYLGALHTNNLIEYEPEYLMEFDRNPDIDEKPPLSLEEVLETAKPFLMAYEGIKNQEEWEESVMDIMEKLPYMKELIDMYSGPDRVTAKQQQQELERVASTLPEYVPSSVKRFTDRAVLSLQSNPGWGFDKKCQFMDKLVWEVSQHYK